MARTTAAEWAKRVAEWKASGETASVFCATKGFDSRRLSWWKWKLEREAAKSRRTASGPMLLPVRVVDSASGKSNAAPVAESPIEVTFPSGARVRVLRGVDRDTLRQVFAALEEVAC